jgi:hypothetical protein
LKRLKDEFGPGDEVVEIEGGMSSRSPVYAMAVITKDGKKRLLLVNTRDHPRKINIPGANRGTQMYSDQTTGFQPPAAIRLGSDEVALGGYSVSAVTLP